MSERVADFAKWARRYTGFILGGMEMTAGALPGRDDGKNRAGIGIPVSAREMLSEKEKAVVAAVHDQRTCSNQGCERSCR